MLVVPGRLWLSLGLLLSVSACKGDGAVTVQDVCELALTCSCSTPPFATVDACVAEFNTEVDLLKNIAATNGLVYNDACFAVALGEMHEVGCGTENLEFDSCSEGCSLIHGDKPLGAACSNPGDSFYSDCGDKLYCAGGTCVDPCARLSAGAPCTDGDFQSLGTCADGLYCDFFGDFTCKALQGLGGPCAGFDECEEGLSCGIGATCEALPAAGEACTGVCAGDLVCAVDVCEAPPGEGESCAMTFSCAEGLECGDSEVCIAREPLLCSP